MSYVLVGLELARSQQLCAVSFGSDRGASVRRLGGYKEAMLTFTREQASGGRKMDPYSTNEGASERATP